MSKRPVASYELARLLGLPDNCRSAVVRLAVNDVVVVEAELLLGFDDEGEASLAQRRFELVEVEP